MRCRLLVALVALVVLAGCSDDDTTPGPSAGSAGAALPSGEELQTYFGAVASFDPDRLAAAEAVAAPGSPAEAYLRYLAAFATSATQGGQAVPPADAEPVDGGFTACGGSGDAEQCVVWADLEGDDGRLADFTVDDTPLADSLRVLVDQAPIRPEGQFTVQPGYAYRSPQSGTLFVMVSVTAEGTALLLQPTKALYIAGQSLLNAAEGLGPTRVESGTEAEVMLTFPDAQAVTLDGQVTFDVAFEGGPSQPVGFGLTTPAG